MYVGFSASTGGTPELHRVSSWEFNSTMLNLPTRGPSPGSRPERRRVLISEMVVVSIVAVAVLVVGLFIGRSWRRASSNNKFGLIDPNLARNLVQLLGWCHEEEQLLLVYDYISHGSLNKWLFHFPERNGHTGTGTRQYEALPLTLRHSVLSGVATALSYLQEECAQCVLHRDIKSSNVLLDGDWNAYLGDFGLARVIDHQKMEKTTVMAGTLGYMAPEMPHTGKATKESDVYSFGVLMLEVMCRMRPLDTTAIELGEGILVNRVWRAHEAGNILEVADSRLASFPPPSAAMHVESCGEFELQEGSLTGSDMHQFSAPDGATDDKKMIANLLHLGLLCCNPNPEDRPSMRLVSQLLLLQSPEDMETALPPIPDYKPQSLFSPIGYSEVPVGMPWLSSSTKPSVQFARQGSSQSTPPSPCISSGESANSQKSFAAPDSIVIHFRSLSSN